MTTDASDDPDHGSSSTEPRVGEHHLLEQAPVPPLDVDGLNVVTIGLVLFGLATVLGVVFHATLVARGHGWWLWVAVCGFLLGLVGLAYCTRRRKQRRSEEARSASG